MTWKPILFCSSDMPANANCDNALSQSQLWAAVQYREGNSKHNSEPSISSEEYFHHKHCDDEKVGITCHHQQQQKQQNHHQVFTLSNCKRTNYCTLVKGGSLHEFAFIDDKPQSWYHLRQALPFLAMEPAVSLQARVHKSIKHAPWGQHITSPCGAETP